MCACVFMVRGYAIKKAKVLVVVNDKARARCGTVECALTGIHRRAVALGIHYAVLTFFPLFLYPCARFPLARNAA